MARFDEVPLMPGATVTVQLPLSAGIEPVPDRSLFKQLAGIGFKIDASNVAWSGSIEIDNLRTESLSLPTPADLDAFPVGTYGGFIDPDGGIENPTENGFLTFAADTTVQGHALRWPMLNADGSDFIVGTAYFGDTNSAGASAAPIFHDWTTLEAQQTSDAASTSVLMSRAFPAARYTSNTNLFIWQTGASTSTPMPRLAVVLDGQITVVHLDETPALSLSAMSEPWVLLWAGSASGWTFDVPTLITFQHRPSSATQSSGGVEFAFPDQMGSVQVMPLYGLARQSNSATATWDTNLSGDAIVQARKFVSILAAFPTAATETYAVDEASGTVTITDSDSHQPIVDDWGTTPTPVAAVPPAVYHAGLNGYPVTYPDGAPLQSEVATWFGPYAYELGDSVRYTLPLAFALSRSPIALRVLNSDATSPVRTQLEQILLQEVPTDPGTYWLGNDEADADFACDGWAAFDPAGTARTTAGSIGPRMAENTFLSRSIAVFTDPVTNQQYLAPTSYPESDLPFDKEWNSGRQLAALARCAEAVDLDIARGAWLKILATYRYHRIYFDWATGSVLSSTLGLTELADGMHFAWDGMLGVGRLARKLGDEQTWNDVAYRTARQQAALYNAWYQGQWVQSIDYGIGHITNAKLPASQVETRGAIDGYVEAYGCSTLEFQSFWETTNYLYFDVPAQLSFYRDYGLEDRVHTLEYEIMPAAHPDWTNGNVMDPVDQRYYGSNYTSAHLVARALLFNDDPTALFALYNSAQGTQAASQWYTMYFHGLAGPTLLSIERAQAPLVEAPLAAARIASSTYDAQENQVAIDFQALTSGPLNFRTRTPGGSFVNHSVSTLAGHRYVLTMTP